MPQPLSAPRYCKKPFPAYAYRPEVNPHPTADPRGHSYRPPGSAEAAATFVPPERWRDSLEYLYGCDLYNHGYWWEAHESFEALWQVTDKSGPQGGFLKGLIHVAAGHLKLELRRPRGVQHFLERSVRNLSQVRRSLDSEQTRFMGLDVGEFAERVQGFFQSRLPFSDHGRPHDTRQYPYIVLE